MAVGGDVVVVAGSNDGCYLSRMLSELGYRTSRSGSTPGTKGLRPRLKGQLLRGA